MIMIFIYGSSCVWLHLPKFVRACAVFILLAGASIDHARRNPDHQNGFQSTSCV